MARAQETLFEDPADDAVVAASASAGAGTLPSVPLAERLRPRTLDDVIGQQHLLAPGR